MRFNCLFPLFLKNFFRLFTLVLINEKPPFKFFLLFSILGHDNEQADAALMKKKTNLEGKVGGLIGQENEIIFV